MLRFFISTKCDTIRDMTQKHNSGARSYKTWLEINKKALLNNVATVRRLLGDDVALMAVVKANAYGHGLIEVVKILGGGIWYGVDSLDEALLVQKYSARQQIMILGYIPKPRIAEALEGNFHISIYSKESFRTIYAALKKLSSKERATNITPHFHLKIETGTNRLGLSLDDLKKLPARFPVDGIYTHFSETENPQSSHYQKQLAIFTQAQNILAKKGGNPYYLHTASTAALVQYPETHGNLVRFGIGLYGLWPSSGVQHQVLNKIMLHPVLTWKTRIAQLKEIQKGETVGYDRAWKAKRKSKIAILPVGYYDGYDRRLSNCGEVLISGSRAKVIGRICMNMIMVDITGVSARHEDEAVLLGVQGRKEISADEIARKIGTINYEVVSRINPLLPHIVV